MNRACRHAFNALKKINVPVFERMDIKTFLISAEENYDDVWADYWLSYHMNEEQPGVHPKITEVLNKYDLYAEWENPGALIVYPK